MYWIRYFHMSTGVLISKRRRELGLTQGQLAELAATSRERIDTYERDQASPQADMLGRVLAAMQFELAAVPALTFEERRSLAISTAVAAKVHKDPAAVMAMARKNIDKMRSIGPGDQRWVDVWETLLCPRSRSRGSAPYFDRSVRSGPASEFSVRRRFDRGRTSRNPEGTSEVNLERFHHGIRAAREVLRHQGAKGALAIMGWQSILASYSTDPVSKLPSRR